jgi:hypothetical protein
VDSFLVTIQGTNLSSNPIVLTWPSTLSQNGTAWTIKSLGSSALVSTSMIGSTGVTVPSDGFSTLYNFLIIKTGALAPTPGPTFVLNNTSLNFGTVAIGSTASQTVNVSNTGSSNPLSITGITAPANYSVTPNTFPVTVAPGTFQTFTVTFSPALPAETKSGNVVFTHNASGSPTNLAVTGDALSQLGTLSFSQSSRNLLDNTAGYKDTLNLFIAGSPLKAIQFTLKTDGQIIFRNIQLGPALPTAGQWNLAYNIFRGPQNASGATDDSVRVLLFGNGAVSLPAADWKGLLTFSYDVVNIADANATSHVRLSGVLGSQADGKDAKVSSAGDETITVKNRTAKGDVNFDDHVDILDLLLIVDHITGKSTLTEPAFSAADVYPYPGGDGAVNVQDLSLLQNIILTGQYPGGQRVSKVAPTNIALKASPSSSEFTKVGNGTDVRVTVHVTKSGIAVRLENAVAVKGMQMEFANVPVVPQGMKVTSALGEAFYGQNNGALTVLLYSTKGEMLDAGDRTVAVLPFSISDPTAVSVAGVVLAGKDSKLIVKSEAVLSNEPIEELPTAFGLEQNYPNPFNPSTDIRFSVPQAGNVKITVYDLLGSEVCTLVSGQFEQGTQVVRWDGKDSRGNSLSSGAYIYRMEAGTLVQTRKMLLLK